MDDLFLARLVGAGRALFGILCLAAPRRVLMNLGKDAAPQIVWWIRAFGARDLVLGTGTLVSLNRDPHDSTWVAAGAVADTADVIVTAATYEQLGPAFVAPTLAIAAPAAALGWKATVGLQRGRR